MDRTDNAKKLGHFEAHLKYLPKWPSLLVEFPFNRYSLELTLDEIVAPLRLAD